VWVFSMDLISPFTVLTPRIWRWLLGFWKIVGFLVWNRCFSAILLNAGREGKAMHEVYMVLGWTQPLTEMNTRDSSLGVKEAGARG
jgi:hypothetical protein